MNDHVIRLRGFILFIALMLLPASHAFSQETQPQDDAALKGVTSFQTAWDFRVGDPKAALGHLGLIHKMLDNPALQGEAGKPEFVVVFIGPSVNLVSHEGDEAAPKGEQQIAEKIAAMKKDGVRFEICMTAAHALDVSAESILPEIAQVGNGWISLIGYQHQGYAMIADF